MNRTFKEVASFTEKWQALGLSDEDLRLLQQILLKNPKAGDVMQGTGGLRKIRIPVENVKKVGRSLRGGIIMGLYEDLEKGLLEAIEMEKGYIPVIQKENMPALTYHVDTREQGLIDEYIELRKELSVSQKELADLIGSKQQAISRVEKKEHCPSLKLFCSMVNALGYELKIVKKN